MNPINTRLAGLLLFLFSLVQPLSAQTPSFTLTTNVNPSSGGVIILSPPGSVYASNTLVALTATANPGFKFQKWSDASNAATNRISLRMNADKAITAIFTNIPMFELTRAVSPIQAGTISPTPTPGTNGYAVNTSVMLTASPNYGFKFSHWTGTSAARTNRISIVMNTNKSVTAVFTNLPTFKLARFISPANKGEILASPAPLGTNFPAGTVVTLFASNFPNYKFSHWSGAANTNRNPVAVTMTANRSITAIFTNIPAYLLSRQVSPAGAGAILASPNSSSNIYTGGTIVTLTAQPNGTNIFGVWLGIASVSNEVTFPMNASRSVTALFNNQGKLLFQNTNGSMAIWFMQRTNRLTSVLLNNGVGPGVNWRLAGAGDFDNNGSKDLLLRHSNGQVALWQMSGNLKTNSVLLKTVPTANRVGAVADFNGDHQPDVLWQHTSGALSLWIMDGTNDTANLSLGSSTWRAFAAAPLDATNSSPDIFFQNSSDGRVAAWLMNAEGTAKTISIPLNNNKAPGAAWVAVGAADMNDDGKTDVIFQREGKLAVWFFNGTTYSSAVQLRATTTAAWPLRATK